MFDLTGKVALVTGASSGIGRASALALAMQGAKVAVCARRLDRLEALVDEIKASGKSLPAGRQEAIAIKMDVTKPEEITNAVTQTITAFGRLDILLNDAGVATGAPLLQMTDSQWDETMTVNLKAYYWMAKAAVPEMAKNHWGRIINISSIASGGVAVGFPGMSNYCASKGGVVAFTESLADELAPMGITVNSIGPGVIETEMTQSIKDNPQQAEGMKMRIPLKRFGKPEEIAAAVVYLASDEAAYTTGATLYIDGGWTAS